MESILFNTSKVWIAENASNGNMVCKFVLCDFGVNLNNVRLNRSTIENWMGSIVNQPLVGKIVRGAIGEKEDFDGHRMRKTYVKNELGNMVQVVTFDTDAYGTFTSIAIEEVDGVECLVATAEVWQRYPKTVQLIKDRIAAGTLHTSWEIEVSAFTVGEDGVKTIDEGTFTALAMLGQRVQPAYDSSRLLEVAEAEVDDELVSAMEEDMKEYSMKKENSPETEVMDPVTQAAETAAAETEDLDDQVSDPDPDTAEAADENDDSVASEQAETETSSITVSDLYERLGHAVREKLKEWAHVSYLFPEEHTAWVKAERCQSELDFILFVYETNGDEVTVDDGTPVKLTVSVASVNEAMAAKDAAIAAAIAENEELKGQVAVLSEIKAKYDEIIAEQEKANVEKEREKLRAYAMKSGLFTEGELKQGNAKKLIDALDQAGINQMIADRYMARRKEQASVETSDAHVQTDAAADITADDVKPVRINAIRAYYEN